MAVISYEIQSEQNQHWRTLSVLEDETQAIVEARRLFGSKRYDRVRVICEEIEGNPHLPQIKAKLLLIKEYGEANPNRPPRARPERIAMRPPKLPQAAFSGSLSQAASPPDDSADIARARDQMLGTGGINPNKLIIVMFSIIVGLVLLLLGVLFFGR